MASFGSATLRRRSARQLVASLGRPLAILAVCAAALGAGLALAATYHERRSLSIGTVELSVSPFGQGAFGVYVPVLNAGARFYALGLPANVDANVTQANYDQVAFVATHPALNRQIQGEATAAVTGYLTTLLWWAIACAIAAGLGAAVLLRALFASHVPRLRWLSAAAFGATALAAGSVAVLLPPQGALPKPVYYSPTRDLSQGFAQATPLPAGLKQLTLASDLHDNLQAIAPIAQAARGSPVFFAGDMGQGGTPIESDMTRQVVATGHPFVYVAGNHDSDTIDRQLAQAGAIVLTQRGQLLGSGGYASVVVNVDGLRVAGYSDPAERQSSDGYKPKSTYPTLAQQQAFASWLRPLVGKVDVVMVHSPLVAQLAMRELRTQPPQAPLVLLAGHTHVQNVSPSANFTELDGGSVGAGGLEALSDGPEAPTGHQPYGLGILDYEQTPAFKPVGSFLVTFNPQQGWAKAHYTRLGAPTGGSRAR